MGHATEFNTANFSRHSSSNLAEATGFNVVSNPIFMIFGALFHIYFGDFGTV